MLGLSALNPQDKASTLRRRDEIIKFYGSLSLALSLWVSSKPGANKSVLGAGERGRYLPREGKRPHEGRNINSMPDGGTGKRRGGGGNYSDAGRKNSRRFFLSSSPLPFLFPLTVVTKASHFHNCIFRNSSPFPIRPSYQKSSLHRPGIEPGPPAWQASILPLNQRCYDIQRYTCFPIYLEMSNLSFCMFEAIPESL